jgi:hypothetical protein
MIPDLKISEKNKVRDFMKSVTTKDYRVTRNVLIIGMILMMCFGYFLYSEKGIFKVTLIELIVSVIFTKGIFENKKKYKQNIEEIEKEFK